MGCFPCSGKSGEKQKIRKKDRVKPAQGSFGSVLIYIDAILVAFIGFDFSYRTFSFVHSLWTDHALI